jgi:hypothetical protein
MRGGLRGRCCEPTGRFGGRLCCQSHCDTRSEQYDFCANDLDVERFELRVEWIDPWFPVRQANAPLDDGFQVLNR